MTELLSYPFGLGTGLGTRHLPADLICAFDRLRNEHHVLNDSIKHLEMMANQLRKTDERTMCLDRLKELKEKTLHLMTELSEHSEWEDTQLFPLLTEYFQLPNRPTMTTSLWMLEKEHELASTYFRLFLEEIEQTFVNPNKSSGGCCTEQLLQACRLVKGHLQMEEETIYPLKVELPK